MTSTATRPPETNPRRTLGSAIAAAVAASICCVGPLVLIALGASGAWMSRLTILEPIRPLLILATGGFLGYAVAQVYARPAAREVCEPGTPCADPRTDRINKVALWGVTILVAGMLMIPTFIGIADREAGDAASPGPVAGSVVATATTPVTQGHERCVLSVQNMTCASCPHNVRRALAAIEGVTVHEVTLDPPRAVVEYDPAKVRIEDLTAATADVGYPSSPADS